MLILITIVLLIIWSALVVSVYSIFWPFISNLWDLKNYNIAYYGAISSIERANLILKYHWAGFEWSWWWIWATWIWPNNDKIANNFWQLVKNWNWAWYEIKSRVNWELPWNNNWNIPVDLWDNSSKNYNKIEYNDSQEFILDIDNTSNISDYYTWNISISWFNLKSPLVISWTFRLPPAIKSNFWDEDLDISKDIDGDWVTDDIIINRTLFWNYNWQTFNTFPTFSINYNTSKVNDEDTAIRESVINNWWSNINYWQDFWWNKASFTPIWSTKASQPTEQNIIPLNLALTGMTFSQILQNTTWLHLKFSLVNPLKTTENYLYPFLEYNLNFCSDIACNNKITIPDRYYNIYWNSKVWKYNVQIKVKKPIVNSDAASDFAIVF